MADSAAKAGDTTGQRAGAARFLASEALGSLGDLGTFIPIVVGLTQVAGLDPGSILVFAGLAHIVTGLVFRIPLPVQPMKAIAALAIAGALTGPQVAVAGLTAGGAVLVMGALGLTRRLSRVVPTAAVRAVQAAVAAKLALTGLRMAFLRPGEWTLRPALGADGLVLAAAALGAAVLLRKRPLWMALALVAGGLATALAAHPGLLGQVHLTVWRPEWSLPGQSAVAGVWLGGLPQLPLTMLNSVLAVSLLSGQFFPERKAAAGTGRMAVSVGLMNLLACPFGGMPMCHGSGGLAAQYSFGARTGVSMIMLGSAKLLVGLFLGGFALAWLQAFPAAVLGVFLIVAGAALGRASRCWETRPTLVVAIVTLAVYFGTRFLVLGFAAGWLAAVILARMRAHDPAAGEEAA